MNPNTDIERILSKKNTRSNLNTMVVNGSIATLLRVAKKQYLVLNTCPIDRWLLYKPLPINIFLPIKILLTLVTVQCCLNLLRIWYYMD